MCVRKYFTDDPLWNRDGCVSANNKINVVFVVPWLFQQFPTKQQDDLLARLCQDEGFNKYSAIDILQL